MISYWEIVLKSCLPYMMGHKNHPNNNIISPKSLILAATSHVKNIVSLHRNKKSDITSLQQPTTTISITANHGRRQQKCPPSAPHEALCHSLSSLLDEGRPPQQVDLNLGGGGGWGGVWPSKHTDFVVRHHCGNKGCFEGHLLSQPPPKLYLLAQGVVAHQFDVLTWCTMPHAGC